MPKKISPSPVSYTHLRLRRIGELLRHRLGSIQCQAQQMIFFLVEQRDLCVTLRQHCQCGGLNTAHIQGTVKMCIRDRCWHQARRMLLKISVP